MARCREQAEIPLLRFLGKSASSHFLDIGENRRLKPAIFAAFFTFSVKLFEFAGLAQDRLTLPA